MYVLTNRYKIHGNGCILYKNLLKKISEEWGCDICIIPSSVHETILMPMDKVESYGEMAQMICEAKGKEILVCGKMQSGSYENKEGKKVYTLECFVKEIEYCGRKEDSPMPYDGQGFMNIPDDLDEELPFR